MTRLELARRLRRECGINGTASDPSSTVNQTGEYAMIVDWLDDAYRDIQSSKNSWQYLRKSFSVSLISGTSEYTPVAVSITDHAQWIVNDVRCYLTATGVSDEQEIFFVEWEEFKRVYLFGNGQSQAGRPCQFTIKPDESIQFWPVPDDAYTVKGEYYRTPVDWSVESDPDSEEPSFPARYHMAIVWGALALYGAAYAESDKYIHGQTENEKIMAKLEFDQLPRMSFGAPLA